MNARQMLNELLKRNGKLESVINDDTLAFEMIHEMDKMDSMFIGVSRLGCGITRFYRK